MALSEAVGIKHWSVYRLTNPKGKSYIGLTCNIKKRKSEYEREAVKTQPMVYNSLRKYGFKNHRFDIIDEFDSDAAYAQSREIFWIRTCMTHAKKWQEYGLGGLNLTDGGDGALGTKMSDANREMHRNRRIGKKLSEETKRKIGAKSKGNKYCLGQKQTPERVAHRTKFVIGNKWGKGPSENNKKAIAASRYKIMKTILVYDKNGVFLQEILGINVAAKILNISAIGIKKVLSGEYKQNKGFVFKYK